ncbi:MAG: AIR synthase related protein [Candidatus Altiarchaeota archaeon]
MADDVSEKYVKALEWIREKLLDMDELANPVMGVRDWDDSVCVDFKGRLLASVDGPYSKRLVLKSALVHAATDVVVKGGRPLFAMDSIIGPKADLGEMIDSLKKQSLALKIPLLGGNTLFEDVEPRCSLTVLGELLLDEPIRDSGAENGDIICLLGEPLWGGMDERLGKARKMFGAWYAALASGVKVNSAKDVTKGGLVSVVYEMSEKSGNRFTLSADLPYPMARNLDNFIITLSEYDYVSLEKICSKHDCRLFRIGTVG